MDYEKKYNEAMLRADEAVQKGGLDKDMFDIIFPPEESEDERIRKWLVNYFGSIKTVWTHMGISCEQILDWLEKQKVNTDGDFARGYDCGYEACLNSHGAEWFEKQKEQKPKNFELKAGKWYICHRAFCCRADHLTVKEGERFMCEKDGIVKGFVIKEPEKYFKECSAPAPMEDEQKEQKPVEWSGPKFKPGMENVLKSLRPSWKPSKDEERLINTSISFLKDFADKGYENAVECIDWLKSKLNGSSGK